MNTRDHFNKLAEHYSKCRPEFPELLDSIAQRMNLMPGKRLVDIGCGPGHDLAYLSRKYGVDPVGVDISENMCVQARKRLPTDNVFLADSHDFFQSKCMTFDAALMKFSIHHFANRLTVLRLLKKRLLRSGVVSIVTMRPADVSSFKLTRNFPSLHAAMIRAACSEEQIEEDLRQAGFGTVCICEYCIAQEEWSSELLLKVKKRYISFLNSVPAEEFNIGFESLKDEILHHNIGDVMKIMGVVVYAS